MVATVDAAMKIELGDFNSVPFAIDIGYEGAAAGLNSSGYARPLVAGDLFLGHILTQCNNSGGSAGTLNVRLRKGRYCAQVALSSVAITDAGQPVFMSDDETYSLTATGNSRVGTVERYISSGIAVVEFEPYQLSGVGGGGLRVSHKYEFDCQTTIDTANHVLIPGAANHNGLVIVAILARVTEVFGGDSQDQGIVTVSDESNNSLATLTALDSGADSLNDLLEGYFLHEGSDGDALLYVAAGEFVDAVITQETSGTNLAGKMEVHVIYLAL